MSKLTRIFLLLITLTAGKAEDDSVAVMVVADTLAVQHDDSVITLSHGFVIRGSERLFIGDRPFTIMSWRR